MRMENISIYAIEMMIRALSLRIACDSHIDSAPAFLAGRVYFSF